MFFFRRYSADNTQTLDLRAFAQMRRVRRQNTKFADVSQDARAESGKMFGIKWSKSTNACNRHSYRRLLFSKLPSHIANNGKRLLEYLKIDG